MNQVQNGHHYREVVVYYGESEKMGSLSLLVDLEPLKCLELLDNDLLLENNIIQQTLQHYKQQWSLLLVSFQMVVIEQETVTADNL